MLILIKNPFIQTFLLLILSSFNVYAARYPFIFKADADFESISYTFNLDNVSESPIFEMSRLGDSKYWYSEFEAQSNPVQVKFIYNNDGIKHTIDINESWQNFCFNQNSYLSPTLSKKSIYFIEFVDSFDWNSIGGFEIESYPNSTGILNQWRLRDEDEAYNEIIKKASNISLGKKEKNIDGKAKYTFKFAIISDEIEIDPTVIIRKSSAPSNALVRKITNNMVLYPINDDNPKTVYATMNYADYDFGGFPMPYEKGVYSTSWNILPNTTKTNFIAFSLTNTKEHFTDEAIIISDATGSDYQINSLNANEYNFVVKKGNPVLYYNNTYGGNISAQINLKFDDSYLGKIYFTYFPEEIFNVKTEQIKGSFSFKNTISWNPELLNKTNIFNDISNQLEGINIYSDDPRVISEFISVSQFQNIDIISANEIILKDDIIVNSLINKQNVELEFANIRPDLIYTFRITPQLAAPNINLIEFAPASTEFKFNIPTPEISYSHFGFENMTIEGIESEADSEYTGIGYLAPSYNKVARPLSSFEFSDGPTLPSNISLKYRLIDQYNQIITETYDNFLNIYNLYDYKYSPLRVASVYCLEDNEITSESIWLPTFNSDIETISLPFLNSQYTGFNHILYSSNNEYNLVLETNFSIEGNESNLPLCIDIEAFDESTNTELHKSHLLENQSSKARLLLNHEGFANKTSSIFGNNGITESSSDWQYTLADASRIALHFNHISCPETIKENPSTSITTKTHLFLPILIDTPTIKDDSRQSMKKVSNISKNATVQLINLSSKEDTYPINFDNIEENIQTPTEIQNISVPESFPITKIYNLQGIELQEAPYSIPYIQNGKIYLKY